VSLRNKITVVAVLCTAAAVAGLGIFALLTDPQVPSEAKTVEPSPQAAPVVQSAPAPPRLPEPQWQVRCASVQGEFDCSARQSIYHGTTGERKRLLSVAVRVPADTEQPLILVRLPLGIYLPAGAFLQIGKTPVKALTIRGCDLDGCFAEDALSESDLAAMLEGKRIKISVQNLESEPVIYRLSVAGFPEAYAKIK